MTKIGAREGLAGADTPVGGREGSLPFHHGPDNDDVCPRHGNRYVIRKGTNQCPKGRKRHELCRRAGRVS